MKKLYLIIFIALALCIHTSAQAEAKTFRGTIGEKKVQLTLTRAGNKLSGKYFYQDIGKDLRLAGTIDAEGNFKLEEYDARNTKTGEFKGKWNQGEGGIYLEGEWTNPKNDKSLIFSLGEEMIYFTGRTRLINKTYAEKNKPKMYEITADYPELVGVNPATAAKFNEIIKVRVMKDVNEFRKAMLGLSAEETKFFKDNGTEAYLEMGYLVDYANDKVISIGFGTSTYEGGAHPNHYSFSVNFDLTSGKKIELVDLFKPKSNYLKVISDYCIKRLKEQQEDMSDDEWIATGAGPKISNYRSWTVKKDGILITFDPYQVAAYAAGPQEVLVPYSELKNILRAGSVVEKL
jgi:Protein of unknown function (DUF3298)/Deacetylase PdaC